MLKKFRFTVTWRIILLTAILLLWCYLLVRTKYYVSIGLLGVLIIWQVMTLIRYVEQTNRKLSRFLNSIRYSDFSLSFQKHRSGGSFAELDDAFSTVINEFKKERAEKEENYQYLQTVVQHIGIGLICFKSNGAIELLNPATKRLFNIPSLRDIKEIKEISASLFKTITNLQSGNRTLVRVLLENRTLQLAVSATTFRMRGDGYKLISLQNIHSELEDKEMEAWQNLTDVLAHEIMNSITPIASLSNTIQILINQQTTQRNETYHVSSQALDDVQEALATINKRSQGLMHFVNSYRDFTQIPEPDPQPFRILELLRRVKNLNKGEAMSQNVAISVESTPEDLEITADPHLIEQVLINLIKNAFRILKQTSVPRISLTSRIDKQGHAIIEVKDNGPGIKPENKQKIFIPFFSTNHSVSQSGSGIGLSLSRQIMHKHEGQLTVSSDEKTGTTFTLRF
ncbi:sensor histidine kinase [Fodinibius salsisoli]|uniref:histidine kinase n=1 Tax=Fodinibius salsisoli TaxID=2820877 RepID=A0ABT3PLV1_9BACT|nr:ATP-binding protein [Fodinibius salsisoli]MCW9706921.1 hypothetical protein [Fodinibius salsisoli]